MLLLALFVACASEPAPVAEPPASPAVAEPEPTPDYGGPVPEHVRCTFEDGSTAEITVLSRWPTTLDFRVGDRATPIGPDTPGYEPYEYTGDVLYTWSLRFEAFDATWTWVVSGLAPDPYLPSLHRDVGGTTAKAPCTRA